MKEGGNQVCLYQESVSACIQTSIMILSEDNTSIQMTGWEPLIMGLAQWIQMCVCISLCFCCCCRCRCCCCCFQKDEKVEKEIDKDEEKNTLNTVFSWNKTDANALLRFGLVCYALLCFALLAMRTTNGYWLTNFLKKIMTSFLASPCILISWVWVLVFLAKVGRGKA